MKIYFEFLLLLPILLFTPNNVLAQINAIKQNKYYPLNQDKIFVYNSNMGKAVKSIEKNDSLFLVTNKTSKFIYTQSLIEKQDGIYLLKTEQKVDVLFFSKDINITYSEPVLQLPNPATIGFVWEWQGFQIKNGDTTLVYLKGKILDEEIVEVPAGKFNTIKIKMDFKEKGGEHTTIFKWLSVDVGNVKSKIIIEGSGILQIAMSLLGYDVIESELKEIKAKVSEKPETY